MKHCILFAVLLIFNTSLLKAQAVSGIPENTKSDPNSLRVDTVRIGKSTLYRAGKLSTLYMQFGHQKGMLPDIASYRVKISGAGKEPALFIHSKSDDFPPYSPLVSGQYFSAGMKVSFEFITAYYNPDHKTTHPLPPLLLILADD